ncbi:MAG: esterase family protein [Saprospiraceae bacterium]|nr:esterase family protein [Saprospiraceae bacterium]
MKSIFLLLIGLVLGTAVEAQNYLSYAKEKRQHRSSFLSDSVDVDLFLPETYPFAADSTRYPVIIIFDSQHEFTFPHIMQTIDLLTGEAQMPESIVVGIPFDYRERFYLTSARKRAGSDTMGIERMEGFLFEELLPMLKLNYQANDYLGLIGHSRTAFLVNYLLTQRSQEVDLAVALSGFYSNEPLGIERFRAFAQNEDNFPARIRYYFTAGTAKEEETYWKECTEMAGYLKQQPLSDKLVWTFTESPNANHMTNYWLSVPPILVDLFADYNHILNHWLHEKLSSDPLPNPSAALLADLKQAGESLNFHLNPSLTHIYSIASDFAFQKKDYQKAIEVLELGLAYYPAYLDFDLTIIDFYKKMDAPEQLKKYKENFRKKVNQSRQLNDQEKKELLENLNE